MQLGRLTVVVFSMTLGLAAALPAVIVSGEKAAPVAEVEAVTPDSLACALGGNEPVAADNKKHSCGF
ncbi:hypothetical protein V8F20_011680 [Naviculisporaceae sp. PSN 640]